MVRLVRVVLWLVLRRGAAARDGLRLSRGTAPTWLGWSRAVSARCAPVQCKVQSMPAATTCWRVRKPGQALP